MKKEPSGLWKHRFTLIELLVVIAIIAILAALLLPALRNARERSKAMTCGNLLNNMGRAQYCYSSDYDGFPVIVYGQSSTYTTAGEPGAKYARFQELLCPYLGWDWDSAVDTWPQNGETVFYCPSSTGRGRSSWGANLRNLLSYGVNRMRSCYDFGPQRFSKIPKPTETLIHGDIYDKGAEEALDLPEVVIGSSWNGTHLKTTDCHFAFHHLGAANVVYYDGHVNLGKRTPNPYSATAGDMPADCIY